MNNDEQLAHSFSNLHLKPLKKAPGYLYCLYNNCFTAYGPDVYKLGRAKDLQQRLADYTTSYIEPSHFVCISSRSFADSRKAEGILFFIFRELRVVKNREFFKVPSPRVRYIIDRLSNLSDDLLEEIYKQILQRICPEEIVDRILDTEEDLSWYNKSIEYKNWLDDFFDRFKFKPKDPAFYQRVGMKPSEEEELYRLIQRTQRIIL